MSYDAMGLIIVIGLMMLSILVFLGKLIFEIKRIADSSESISHNTWEILNWVAEKKGDKE